MELLKKIDRNYKLIKIIERKLNDEHFLINAKLNLLMLHKNYYIKQKYNDFLKIATIFSKIRTVNYAIIKSQPMITHLGNDIDILMNRDDIPIMLNFLKKFFSIKRIDIHEQTLDKVKVTVYFKDMYLNQLEIYTYIGWYGLRVFNSFNILVDNIKMKRLIFPEENITLVLKVLSEPADAMVQISHILVGERYLTLSDTLRLLLLHNDIKNYLNTVKDSSYLNLQLAYGMVLSLIKNRLSDLLLQGKTLIPFRGILPISYMISFNNFVKVRNYRISTYYKELRRLLSSLYQSIL